MGDLLDLVKHGVLRVVTPNDPNNKNNKNNKNAQYAAATLVFRDGHVLQLVTEEAARRQEVLDRHRAHVERRLSRVRRSLWMVFMFWQWSPATFALLPFTRVDVHSPHPLRDIAQDIAGKNPYAVSSTVAFVVVLFARYWFRRWLKARLAPWITGQQPAP